MGSKKSMVDWFVDGKLFGTFNSYEHAAEILQKELKNPNISGYTVKQVVIGKQPDAFRSVNVYKDNEIIRTFVDNTAFMDFYGITQRSSCCNIINGKLKLKALEGFNIKVLYKVPDLRPHIFEQTDEKRKCTCCEIEKPLTEEFFYRTGNKFRSKCKKCNLVVIGDKRINKFLENIKDDNWKSHPDFPNIYFEKDTEQIYNTESDKNLSQDAFTNLTSRLAKDIKWEAFNNQKIEENKIVSFKDETNEIKLNNLNYDYLYCNTCSQIIVEPTLAKKYCSKRCLLDSKNTNANNTRNINLVNYLSHKLNIQRNTNKSYNQKIDYNLYHLLDLGNTCYYCNIECQFGYNKENNHPDTLSFDRKDPDIGYCKENIVVSCWFCNRMKNQTKYPDWIQFMDFIRNDSVIELDLSNKPFAKKYKEINKTNIWFHVFNKSPLYYSDLKTAEYTFIELCQKQNFVDPFFKFFPIIHLGSNCLYNASIDAIDATLPPEERHRPDNIQVIPKCFNYGKNILSNEAFIDEWT
jgi:hypothetical protein